MNVSNLLTSINKQILLGGGYKFFEFSLFQVRTIKMHMFTIIQVILVVILWIVKSTIAAIAFPLLVFLMVPLRLRVMPKFFTHEELEVVRL